MANELKVVKSGGAKGGKSVYFIAKLSGNYVQAVEGENTGEVLHINEASNPGFEPNPTFTTETFGYIAPVSAIFKGYPVEFIAGADKFHWLLKIYKDIATELDAGAYPAALDGAEIMLVVTGNNF